MCRRPIVFRILFLLLVSVALHVRAQDIPFDTGFGNEGIVVGIDLPGDYYTNYGGELLSLGSGQFLLAVGASDDGAPEDVIVIRYNGDGTVDTTFGNAGYAIVDWSSEEAWASGGMALDNNGRIAVAGYVGTTSLNDPALAVMTAAGYLDPSFDTDGLKVIAQFDDVGFPRGVVTSTNNDIVYVVNYGDQPNLASYIAKVTASGAEDPSFATFSQGTSMAVARDAAGRFVWANGYEFNGDGIVDVLRLLNDGTADPEFNDGQPLGLTFPSGTYFGLDVEDVVFQSAGQIVVAGGASNAFYAWRYLDDFGLDPNFGVQGVAKVDLPLSDLSAALVDPSDGILLVGYADQGSGYDLVVVRLLANGEIDDGFGTNGVLAVDMDSGSTDVAVDAVLLPDGDLLIAGEVNGAVAVGMTRLNLGFPLGLVVNPGFETGSTAETSRAFKWKGKNLTKDKRSCSAAYPSCVFVFKGSAKEQATISQTIKLPADLRAAGTAFTLEFWSDSITGNTILGKVVVNYDDGTTDAFSIVADPDAGHHYFGAPPFMLAKNAKKLKVSFNHSAATGTLYLDDIALVPNNARALPPPVPALPAFRSLER